MSARTFSHILRGLIARNFGNETDFALAAGLSLGRVSQLLSGRETNLSYRSLQILLKPLSLLADQEQLYRAWLAACAPAPSLALAPLDGASDTEIEQFLLSGRQLKLSDGHRFLSDAAGLWLHLSRTSGRTEAAMKVGATYAEVAFHLERRYHGVRMARAMLKQALQRQEPNWAATALWLRAVGTRTMDIRSVEAHIRPFQDLSGYLAAWQPREAPERSRHAELTYLLQRDMLLLYWDLERRHRGFRESLLAALQSLGESEFISADEGSGSLDQEIRARGLIALGDFDSAREALDAARRVAPTHDGVHWVKTDITEIRLLIAEGDRHGASELLEKAIPQSEKINALHHRLELAKLEQAIYGSLPFSPRG